MNQDPAVAAKSESLMTQNMQVEMTSPVKQKKYRPRHDDEEPPEESSPARHSIKRDPTKE